MADTRLVASGSFAHTAFTDWIGVGSGGFANGVNRTESRAKVIQRTAGVYNNLQVNCTTHTSSTVISMTKSTVYGTAGVTQTLTVTIAGTGITEDTTHTFTTAAADMLDWTFSALASTFSLVAVTFAATTNTACRLLSLTVGAGGSGASFTNASQNYFQTLAGQLVSVVSVAESNALTRIRKAGTLTNLFVNVSVNNGGGSGFSVTSRVASGAGNLTTGTIASGTTGFIEDTSHTDTRVAGDDADTLVATLAGAQNINISVLGLDFTSTNGDGVIITGSDTSLAVALSTTTFMGLGGGMTTNATETAVQTTVRDAFTTSNLSALSTANTVSATSTISLRKGASSTGMNQTISFASNTASLQTDSTHTDVFVATDLVDYKTVTGGTGTSISLAFIELWTNLGGAVGIPTFFDKMPYTVFVDQW